jgi:type II secretory pathway component PulM
LTGDFAHYARRRQDFAMRKRAIAIAVAEQKARESRMIVAAALLLLPALLILLLISP